MICLAQWIFWKIGLCKWFFWLLKNDAPFARCCCASSRRVVPCKNIWQHAASSLQRKKFFSLYYWRANASVRSNALKWVVRYAVIFFHIIFLCAIRRRNQTQRANGASHLLLTRLRAMRYSVRTYEWYCLTSLTFLFTWQMKHLGNDLMNCMRAKTSDKLIHTNAVF